MHQRVTLRRSRLYWHSWPSPAVAYNWGGTVTPACSRGEGRKAAPQNNLWLTNTKWVWYSLPYEPKVANRNNFFYFGCRLVYALLLCSMRPLPSKKIGAAWQGCTLLLLLPGDENPSYATGLRAVIPPWYAAIHSHQLTSCPQRDGQCVAPRAVSTGQKPGWTHCFVSP